MLLYIEFVLTKPTSQAHNSNNDDNNNTSSVVFIILFVISFGVNILLTTGIVYFVVKVRKTSYAAPNDM